MNHASLAIYDYKRRKVCDLYDSSVQAEGQAYNITYTEELLGWKEISFELPFMVKKKWNYRWDNIRSEYLQRMRIDDSEDWFILQTPKKTKNGKAISNTVKCGHISSVQKTKKLYQVFDDTNGIGTISYLINQVQEDTGWSLGHCDYFAERDGSAEKVRSISSDGKKGAYQQIADICNLFNAYPVYRGDTMQVDILSMDMKLAATEMYIGKNLDAVTVEINTDNIVTRLYVEGEYGDLGYVGIDDVNPTGLSYLLDFSYYKSIGLFEQEHQQALNDYLRDMPNVKAEAMAKQQEIMADEDALNELWGRCDYVFYYINDGAITRAETGGDVLDEQKEIAAGDEQTVFKVDKTYRILTAEENASNLAYDDKYAIKFITLPSGKIGARQVAEEAGISDLEYQADDDLTLTAAMAQALDLALAVFAGQDEFDEISDRQKQIESIFAGKMKDMLRDGYWSNTNYAPGQEQQLYWDALDHMEEVSQPEIKYSLTQAALPKNMGFKEELPRLNAKIHLIDEDLRVNSYIYVTKRTICLDDRTKDKIEISNKGLASAMNSFDTVLQRMTQQADLVDQKNKVYERAKVVNYAGYLDTNCIANGSLPASALSGFIGDGIDLSRNTVIAQTRQDVTQLKQTVYETKYKYGQIIEKPFSFSGKTAAFFGDDVTAGIMATGETTTGQCADNWVKLFCDKVSLTADNQAAAGSSFMDTESADSILNRVLNYAGTADYIFISGGQTDWMTATKQIGVLGDMTADTFYGALYRISQKIKTSYPSAGVIFITDINKSAENVTPPYHLNAWRNAMFETAAKYGFSVVDGSKIGFPSEKNLFAREIMPDGLHPSEAGHRMMYQTQCGIQL